MQQQQIDSSKFNHDTIKYFLHKSSQKSTGALDADVKRLTELMTPGDDDLGGHCDECGQWSLVSKSPDVCPFCGVGDVPETEARVASEVKVFIGDAAEQAKRKPGRPKKEPKESKEPAEEKAAEASAPTVEKRKPGRPKKEPPVEAAASEVVEKRKPGRPRKNIIAVPAEERPVVVLQDPTAPALQAAVSNVRKFQLDTFSSYWALANEVRRIYDEKIYMQEVDTRGKAIYENWGAFCTDVLRFSRRYANMLMLVARQFTQEQVQQLGVAKLNLIASADKQSRGALVEKAQGGATLSELGEVTRKLRQKGDKTLKEAPSAPNEKGLILLQFEERRFTVPLYERVVNGAPRKAAKALATFPHGEYLTVNGMRFLIWVRRDESQNLVVDLELQRQDRIDD